MAVSGLAGVLRVVRRGGFNHQPVWWKNRDSQA